MDNNNSTVVPVSVAPFDLTISPTLAPAAVIDESMTLTEFTLKLQDYVRDHHTHYMKQYALDPANWPIKGRNESEWFEDFLAHLGTQGYVGV